MSTNYDSEDQEERRVVGFADENLFSLRCSMLASNAFIAVLSSPEERTSQFGVLQGIAMREFDSLRSSSVKLPLT